MVELAPFKRKTMDRNHPAEHYTKVAKQVKAPL